ncbi:hypothetical protein BDV19DRAFT_373826 [Aspergillus venezuelensis]
MVNAGDYFPNWYCRLRKSSCVWLACCGSAHTGFYGVLQWLDCRIRKQSRPLC